MSLFLPETVDEQQPLKNRHTPPDSHCLATNSRQSSLHHQQCNESLVTSSPTVAGDDVIIVDGGGGGSIRVKSNENLFENYQSPHKTNRNKVGSDIVTKSSVSFNSSPNTEAVQLPPPSDDSCYVIDDDDEILEPQLPPSLKFNSNTMTISVKPITSLKRSSHSRKTGPLVRVPDMHSGDIIGTNLAHENFENIICSPNLIEIPYMDDEYDIDDDAQQHDAQDSSYICDDADISNTTMSNGDEPMPRLIPFGLLQNQIKDESVGYHVGTQNELFGSNSYRRSMDDVSITLGRSNSGKIFNRKILFKKGMTVMNNGDCSPSPSAVVLRHPRGNQPRTYTTDALYAALMDVKDGESIYR